MAKRRLLSARSKKQGLPPGTPVYVGEEKAGPIRMTVIRYDEENVTEKPAESVEECLSLRDESCVMWINCDGVHDAGLVQALSEAFGLHPLVQEDILHTSQRAKVEDHTDYTYIVLQMLRWDEEREETITEQVSLILGDAFVLSFQERPGDVFGPLRDRIRTAKGRIRTMKADYLAYNLLDAIVDGYFVILEKRGEQMECLEDELVSQPSPATLEKIHHMRREALFLRKAVWPVREMIAGLERAESPRIGKAVRPYLRDLYDHAIQVIDTTETLREMLSGMLDTYLSSQSNRMNEVMKVLTIIATIFIPLTFVAGIYGMNFKAMPELEWRWGYAGALTVMAAVALAMVLYIRKKNWL